MAEHKRALALRIRKARKISGNTREECDSHFGGNGRYHKMEDGKTSISHASRLKLARLFEVHPSMMRTIGMEEGE